MYSSSTFQGAIGLMPRIDREMPTRQASQKKSSFVAWVKGPGQLVLMIGGLIVSIASSTWILSGKQSATTYEIIMAKNEFAAAKTEIASLRAENSAMMKLMADGEATRRKAAIEERNAVIESLRYMLLLRERARNSQIERIIRELEIKKISETDPRYDAGGNTMPARPE